MAYAIGIDVGTTGTKTVLLETGTGIVATHAGSSPLFSDATGFAEADPAVWVANAVDGIRAVLQEAGVAGGEVAAVSATGMVPAVVLLDADLRPLRRAILQNDARADLEITELAGELAGHDVLAHTGSALTQQSVAPTTRWLARHEAGIWERTRFIVGSYDYLLMALGAEPHLEENWALESGLFELDGRPFAPMVERAGIAAEQLPPVHAPGAVVGGLSARMAEATGLRPGCALVVGGADHVLSAYAAGVNDAGDWIVKLGGAGDLLAASPQPIVDTRLYLDRHPRAGIWLPNACMATSGSLIRWFQELVGGVRLPELDDEAATRPAASLLCLPYFMGEKSPLHDPLARGTFAGLHLGHTRADLYRAVLESIAFGFLRNAEVMREQGIALERAVVTNGGSNSRFWMQIHADVLGSVLHPVIGHPGASLGAAISAARGVEAIDHDAIQRFVKLDTPLEPRPDLAAVYADAYAEWADLSAAVAPISHRVATRSRETSTP